MDIEKGEKGAICSESDADVDDECIDGDGEMAMQESHEEVLYAIRNGSLKEGKLKPGKHKVKKKRKK